VRVVFAEDLTLLRDGLTRLLEAFDFEVVEAVDNGPALLPSLLRHRPDVAIVDVRLPPTYTDEGLKAPSRPARRYPGCRCWCSPSTSRLPAGVIRERLRVP
jgi:DNA-binding NarL/FixJ family response regulator